MANLRAKQQREAEAYVKKAGYARGGDVAQDKAMVRAGVGQHEGNMHRGKARTSLKLATGGIVSGNERPARLDKRARGGGITPGLPGKSRGTNVNIMLHTADQEGRQKAAQQGMQQGAMLGAKAAMAKMGGAPGAPGAPSGAPGGPPPGAPPGGGMAPPGLRPPGMKRGGAVKKRASGGRLPHKDVGGEIAHPALANALRPGVQYPNSREALETPGIQHPAIANALRPGVQYPNSHEALSTPGIQHPMIANALRPGVQYPQARARLDAAMANRASGAPAMKRGGRVPMKAGAGSGEGRLEKIKAQHSGKQRVRSYERKARGGKV